MEIDQCSNNEDTEWIQFFQNALKDDSKLEYKENPLYNYSENGIDYEITEQEQQRYVSLLMQIPEIYQKLNYWPSNPKQKMLVLAIAIHVSRDERNFIRINSNNTYKALVKMCQISKPTTDSLVKVRYMDMISSFFEHDAGLRWSLETNYWTDLYNLVIQCQDTSNDISEKMYHVLSKFLLRTSKLAPKVCAHVTKQITETLLNVAHKTFYKVKIEPPEFINPNNFKNLNSSVTCLIEILERLLTSPVTDPLKYFIKIQVREAGDTLAILSNDRNFSLQINRVIIILSFYEMAELFDGIKVVNHDPIALSGFLRIVERELKKCQLKTIFQLYYYAQKYWKNVSRKMPQYFAKEKPVDIEDELMSFQVEPLVIIAEKLLGVSQTSEEELRNCLLADLLNMYSADSLPLGYEIREQLNIAPLDIEITALQYLIKSKPLYSRKNLAIVFQTLNYALRDFIKYIKQEPEKKAVGHDLLAETLLDAILAYLENFNLSWRESIGSIELTNLVYEFLLYSSGSSSEVIIKALETLNITIYKHMSPNMALLVDAYSSLNDIGSMLFNKCFNHDPNVRNVALTVVCTICQKVNKGFSSFKNILTESLTQDLILSMSLKDFDCSVRATALKCLQEMTEMRDLETNIVNCEFTDKILNLVSKETAPIVVKEAVTLIAKIFQSECNSERDYFKMYSVMRHVAIREENPDVQEHAVKFWERVAKKYLEKYGMTDDVFPSVIFSKEDKKIIRMNDKEIRKRLFQALDGMSKSGCFNVFHRILQNENTSKQVFTTIVAIVTKLLRLLQQYEVTPEFILFNQTYPNLWSVSSNITYSPLNFIDEDDCMQEIIEKSVMEMINGSESFNQNGSVAVNNLDTVKYAYDKNSEQTVGQLSTVDFMDFITRKLPFLSN